MLLPIPTHHPPTDHPHPPHTPQQRLQAEHEKAVAEHHEKHGPKHAAGEGEPTASAAAAAPTN